MKAFQWILLIFFLMCFPSCKPLESSGSKGPRDRGIGEPDFEREVDDIDLNEIRKKVKEAKMKNCGEYECKSSANFSLLGKYSPARAMQNCLCKLIDEGLAPLCAKEKQLKKLAKEHKNNDEAMEEIEIALEEIEIMKEDIGETLYETADAADELHADVEDEIDDLDDDADSVLERFFVNGGLRLVAKDQIGSTTRFAERRARNVCFGNFTFGKDEESNR